MKMIYVRFRSLMLFGMVLLCISFVWIGLTTFNKNTADVDKTAPVISQPKDRAEPTVTIVPQEQKTNKDNFFSEYRIERDRTRSEKIEILREIVNNNNSSAQVRQEAQQNLIKISDYLEKESKIENALLAKGFKEAVAVIQPGTVMVIVPSTGLRQDEVARITDMVVKIAGCSMEDVVIVPKAQ